jgi:16S rRNA (cytosine1402-N4)-methyltransferase
MIRDYGEEKFARKIARTIVEMREKKPFETTGDLNQAIVSSIPMKARRTGGNPCKRTYQAVRIKLNRELTVLEESLDGMIDILNDDGRFCIITFHSLEDRIVKNDFRRNEDPCTCPKEFPVCVCGKKSKGKVVTRKPVLPTEKELEENSRSKSAKLRVFERRTPK